jgi:hypothetical protein
MSKKNKFNLTDLVHKGLLTEGQLVLFVSDNSKTAKVHKCLNHEYKLVDVDGEEMSAHHFSQKCLGQEPPDHGSKWIRTEAGPTLYDLWQQEVEE